jgi:hypothetical protein
VQSQPFCYVVSSADPLHDLTTRYEHKSQGWCIRHPTVMTTNHSIKPLPLTSTTATSLSSAASGAASAPPRSAERHLWTVRLKVAPKTFVDASLAVEVVPCDLQTWRQHKVSTLHAFKHHMSPFTMTLFGSGPARRARSDRERVQ